MTAETKLPTGNDLLAEIDRLRKERNAVILAHYYQTPDIQDLADYVGDSLQLSQMAAETDADVIAFCGVKFMADTAKILSPEKIVVLPDMDAMCRGLIRRQRYRVECAPRLRHCVHLSVKDCTPVIADGV